MEKSRLIELFKSLEKVEVKKLRKWVRSPFFNQRQDVILLFDYLDRNRPLEKKEQLDRHYVFSKIFPNEPYNEKKIGYAQTFLMTEIKKFLAYQDFSQNEIQPQISVVRSLRKKGLNRLFESDWKNVNELLEKQPIRNAEYHFYNYQLYNEQYEYTNSISRKHPKGLQEASDELTNYFIAQKLKQGCDKLSHKSLINADYQKDFLDKVINYVEEINLENVPAIQIYYSSFKTQSEVNTNENYKKLKKLLKSNQNYFPKQELNYLYLATINYCIKQINAGKGDFTKEALELYQEGLKTDIFLTNGFLDRFTYKNIVSAAILLKEFDWVKKFIYQYKDLLDSKWKEDTFNYSLALMYYSLPDYSKAMPLLQKAEFKDLFHILNARRMLLKMYFELKEFDALDSFLDSFERYLNRHKALGYHKEHNINLIKVTRKMIRLPQSIKEKEKFKNEVELMEGLIDKKWVVDQLK